MITKPIAGGDYLGHITGFSYNEYDHIIEMILEVKWFTGTEQRIHPENVEVL